MSCAGPERERRHKGFFFFWGGFNFVSLMVVGFIGMAELSCEPGGDSIDGNSIGTGDHFLALVVEC